MIISVNYSTIWSLKSIPVDSLNTDEPNLKHKFWSSEDIKEKVLAHIRLIVEVTETALP